MAFSEEQLLLWLAAFIWPMIRIGAFLASSPIINSRQTPVMFRLSLLMVLTWLVMPLVPPPLPVDVFSSEAFLMVLQQILIGVAMGFVLQMVFGALTFGGQVMAYSMGRYLESTR